MRNFPRLSCSPQNTFWLPMISLRLLLVSASILVALSVSACKNKADESAARPAKPFVEWTNDLGATAVPQQLINGSGNWYIPAKITGLDMKAPLWERDVSTLGLTRYASAAGRVFFIGSKGYAGALDAATGQTIWEVTPKIGLVDDAGTPVEVAVTKRSLIIATSRPAGNGELRFLKPGNGELLRTEQVDYEIAQLIAADGRIFAISDTGEITSFSETDGSQIEEAHQVTGLQDVTVCEDRLVFYGREMAAFSLDMATLKPLGARVFEQRMNCLFSMGGELLLFAVDKAEMVALDPRTLEVNWQRPLESKANMLPAGFDNKLFLGEEGGRLRCLDMKTGKYVWTREIEASCYVFIVFDNCVLAIADYPPDNSSQLGQRQRPETPPKAPSWYKGNGAHNYSLFVLSTADGSTIGQFTGDGYLLPQCVTDKGIIVREDPAGTLACYPYKLEASGAKAGGSAK